MSSLKVSNTLGRLGGQDGRIVSRGSENGIQLHIDYKAVKHVHENVVRFLKELNDEGIPKSLPNPDLKAIAMDSDAGNSIKAGFPTSNTFE